MQAAESRDLGYIPVGGGIDDVDARLTARPATSGAGPARAPRNDVDEAALDEVRRAHFLYGLEEIQSVAERSAESG